VLFTPASAPTHQNNGIKGFGAITSMDNANGHSISLDNSEAYTALQMVVTLPLGSSLKDVSLNGNPSHYARFQHIEGGSNNHGNQYKVVVWSADGTALCNTDNFLQLQTIGRKGDVTVSNIQLTNEEFETIVLPDANMTTGVDVITDASTDGSLYNLQGIKTTQTQRGVYIRDNRKVVFK
jgi:hypothetical protein